MEFEVIEKGSTEGIAGNLCICDDLVVCNIKIFAICPCVEGGYCTNYCECH